MMKIKGAGVSVAAWCLVVILAVEVREMAAATCDPTELRSCLRAITGLQSPSKECCSKLTDQVPSCYCTYVSNPTLKPYIDSPVTNKVAESCGLTIPTCS